MIVVDTSVWVEGFRGAARIQTELTRLIDADLVALVSQVRLELLEGCRPAERVQLRRVLGAVPTFVPMPSTWTRVEEWIGSAAKTAQRFGVVDLLIGATAREHHASIWSLDSEFDRMARLRFVKIHRPRAAMS